MYAINGRSWVALGDPVGPEAEMPELIWKFHEICDRHNGWTVFYEIERRNLHIYIDLGLTLLKLGEEARVPLTTFSLEGYTRKGLRHTYNRIEKEEISGDLMRHLPDAPNSVIEYLFIQLMLWGKQEGYKWFNLGMAPLSGLEEHALAPLWNRLGSLVFRHGEHFYNFQGLRRYKEKFDPEWEPKYLASPGGLKLSRILTNIALLISRSPKGIVVK